MLRFFSTTLGQILTIITLASAMTIFLFTLLLIYHEPPHTWRTAYRIASTVGILQEMPEGLQAQVLAAMQQRDFSVAIGDSPELCQRSSRETHELESTLQDMLPSSRVAIHSCGEVSQPQSIQAVVPFGRKALTIRTELSDRLHPRILRPFHAMLLFMCIAVAALSAWAVWRVIRPLRHLSEKADAFGKNMAVSPLVEEGPLELRRVTRAFNHMQQRITSVLQARTRMLAAIGHDLRTPLTRMKLQIETGKPEDMRVKLLRDIGVLQSMVTSVLAYLSGAFDGEEAEWLDLGALLNTLCDEYREAGSCVSYAGPEMIRFFCKPNAISRLLTNLIDNGISYGKEVTVTASLKAGQIHIEVRDKGPGIPQEKIQEVLDPFVRLDPSRAQRPGSVGLGLSIVKEIVEAHGGTLELTNLADGGLAARVSFPAQA